MVKNDRGGNKAKKQKRSFGKFDATDKLEPGQMFAQITHNHGGSFSVMCSDGISRLGKLSGYMKKGPRLSEGSYVVISLRDFESEQKNCDIIAYGDPPSEIIGIFKKKPDICAPFSTGCSAVRLAHLLWEQGVVSSNPTTPTNINTAFWRYFFYVLS